MKKSTKVRIAVCLCMIALAVVLSIVLDGRLTGPQSQMWQRMIFIVAVIGTGVAGFFGMLMGTWGFVMGYGFVLMLFLPEALPDPWGGYFIVAALSALFIWTAVSNRGKKSSETHEGENPDDELTEEELQEIEKYSSLMIVDRPTTGRMYQLICKDGELLAYRVGGELKGVDTELLQMGNEQLRPLGDKDFSIRLSDIRSVKITKLYGSWMSSKAVVKVSGKTYRLNALGFISDEKYADFWTGILPEGAHIFRRNGMFKPAGETVDDPAPNEKRLAVLRVVKMCMGVYLAAVNLLWLFVDVPYGLFSVLSTIALPIILILYFCFPNELTMDENRDEGSKISLMFLMFMAGVVPALRTLLDYNIQDGWRMFYVCAVVFVLIMALFLLLSKEWRSRKIIAVSIAFAMLYYAIGAVGQINGVFDLSEPHAERGIVTDMHISDGSSSPDSYYLTIELPNGEETELRTYEEHYESLDPGDEVTVYTYQGALGIPYAYAG